VLDAGDIEEVVLVVVGQKPVHLRRIHATEGLRDVDRRITDSGKNIHRHTANRERCRSGEREHRDNDGNRTGERGESQAHGLRFGPRT
jgi:hypothetical protein